MENPDQPCWACRVTGKEQDDRVFPHLRKCLVSPSSNQSCKPLSRSHPAPHLSPQHTPPIAGPSLAQFWVQGEIDLRLSEGFVFAGNPQTPWVIAEFVSFLCFSCVQNESNGICASLCGKPLLKDATVTRNCNEQTQPSPARKRTPISVVAAGL